jgi:hypothetical protein
VGIGEAVVPVAAESAGAVVVVAVSWLVVEELQAASSKVLLKLAASNPRRGEIGMRKRRKMEKRALFA